VVQRIRQLRNATSLRDRGGAWLPWKWARALMQVRQFVDRQLNIAQDRTQQTRTNRLTGMNGNCGGPAVGVPEKDVAPRVRYPVKPALSRVLSLEFFVECAKKQKQILRLTTPKLKGVWGPVRSG